MHDPAGRVVYGGDAKYKMTSDGRGRNADYYQLFAYLTALRLREGVLIYCQADDAPEREVVVSHVGTRLWTYPLSLAGSVDEVEGAASDLAGWLVEHADAPGLAVLAG